jgi:hypothetical protein
MVDVMRDLMPEQMPGQVSLLDLPRDSRFKHDASLRHNNPQVIANDALAWLNSLKIPRAITPDKILLYTNQSEYETAVRQAIDDENQKYQRKLSYPNLYRYPFAFASHAQGGKIHFSPDAHKALISLDIEIRAYVWRSIAHEYWHAIRQSPMQFNPESNLEEGMAQEFAERMSRVRLGGIALTKVYEDELLLLRQLMKAWGSNQNKVWRDMLASRTTENLAQWLWDETLKRGFSSIEVEKLLGYKL